MSSLLRNLLLNERTSLYTISYYNLQGKKWKPVDGTNNGGIHSKTHEISCASAYVCSPIFITDIFLCFMPGEANICLR